MASAVTDTNERDVVGTTATIKTLRFVFDNLKIMQRRSDQWVHAPPLEAFGYLWRLRFFPRRNSIKVHLDYAGDWDFTDDDKNAPVPSTQIAFRFKGSEEPFETKLYRRRRLWEQCCLEREDVLKNNLEEDGSSIIEVDLQVTIDKRVWYPKTIPTETRCLCCESDGLDIDSKCREKKQPYRDWTDIVFVVDNKHFFVHKSVLSSHAKTLFAFYKEHRISRKKRKRSNNTGTNDYDDDDDDSVCSGRNCDPDCDCDYHDDDDEFLPHPRVPFIIPDMNSETFKQVVEYIYSVNTTPTLVDEATATKLLLAAHRFGCLSLQLYVESVLVDKFVTPTNAASMLLLGDTYHYSLLKEAAMRSYWSDPTSFRESDTTTASWSKIQESSRLLEELLVYTSNKLVATRNSTTTTTTMDVGTLHELVPHG